ncbi:MULTISPECIES: universal stress protein [unclassified Roseitalea]|uniref:universal stress protein n=1 Tax=unclassified Roseitalea TaxID=2639107 RepID=UPI0027402137|nr:MULTISPECIES: universal stress protein [unclassified Roseitalea]
MTTVFHPTDLSPASTTAFRHALRLALEMEAGLTICHVHGPHRKPAAFGEFPAVRATLSKWGEAADHLPDIRKVEAVGSNVQRVVGEYLARHPADLVVMASHPRTGLAAWLKPSIAQAVFEGSHRPSLIIPDGAAGFVLADGSMALDSVLLAMDEEPDPQIGVDTLAGLLRHLDRAPEHLTLLHAGTRPLRHEPVVPDIEGMATRMLTVSGPPPDAIVKAAARFDARLIVMTSAGHDSLPDRVFGSTFDHVLAQADCPVLVLPAPSYAAAASV